MLYICSPSLYFFLSYLPVASRTLLSQLRKGYGTRRWPWTELCVCGFFKNIWSFCVWFVLTTWYRTLYLDSISGHFIFCSANPYVPKTRSPSLYSLKSFDNISESILSFCSFVKCTTLAVPTTQQQGVHWKSFYLHRYWSIEIEAYPIEHLKRAMTVLLCPTKIAKKHIQTHSIPPLYGFIQNLPQSSFNRTKNSLSKSIRHWHSS